jgi:hypothetical protein
MIRSSILILIMSAVFSVSAYTQVLVGANQKADSFNRNVYGLGVSGGPASGIGISFRNHLPSKASYQIVGGIIKASGKISATIGAEFQYDLVRGSSTRLYFGPGVGYYYSGADKNTFKAPFRFGIGVGGEFNIKDALHASLEGMFIYHSDGTILPLPQIAFHYYFL